MPPKDHLLPITIARAMQCIIEIIIIQIFQKFDKWLTIWELEYIIPAQK